MTLERYTVLVTGAGRGVGQGIARALALDGAHVFVGTRSHNGREVAAQLVTEGCRATWVRCDVTAQDSMIRAVETAITETGRLDALVHNATSNASSQPHRLEDVGEALWRDHFDVSVAGAYHCAVAAFEALRDRAGTFLVMTSPAGIEGSATLPLYATMKGALRGFAKSLAREWGPHGVTVNIISPLAYSPALTAAIEAEPAMEERLARRIPLGRIGDPQNDIGAAVTFLVGPRARYVTGQTIGVDGGHFTNL